MTTKKTVASLPVSPLAPKKFAKLAPLAGVELQAMASGSRYVGRDDLLLVRLAETTQVAGVFTRSKMPSAAVDLSRAHLAGGKARALVVNAGNANAFTGKAGAKAALDMAKGAAKLVDCQPEDVLIASTGVIGEDLDPAPLLAAMQDSQAGPAKRSDWQAAARAIMTTDTFAKAATRTAKFGKHQITLNAIAKGSGMIAPDMATLLAFVFTDAHVPARLLQKLLSEANGQSLNCVTVDGDTSTSDTCLMFASGDKKCDGAPLRSLDDKRLAPLRAALAELMQDLAVQVASDGEGISKLMTIEVMGAETDAAARNIGLAIGNSPLVKTAVAGEDANWGRIVMAIGKSGEAAERDRLSIDIGGVQVARKGRAVAGYDERPVAKHMRGRHVHIRVNVGVQSKTKKKATGKARIWASDLTHGYIDINADYRS
ncbi:MAG: bifunctional glutamate N-acetyltransferase/amino-acid acetyltransferase ArgJ [Rhodobiaceae bacterium]|jgi:glutamate N-acetyltransferase/amino-acid N-acetyltransferase|nr:bifunctional glutamate N-acetyltransferase/amino-acid acetyltransferase ArgJ [Rhodobiaceae bacterium]MBT5518881.1 bifunctional glutamate N-acetyltransferase/amino-acid acetyltransferase ArgJ [Rhodobiaceae bacterium]MBT7279849.1 bifunctional glutamate N-acetyltransferase/amino-acid acetyltransferase ArgJ [Rhodobiaceae bacterium]MDG2495239.1 bifunctional glutamate N-acetyltransferase/amino-acid acetyltransferase ArgJ [Alphaproteobacteria bacterium]